jgi:phosphoglycolate phosphatase-like HAD superfamily hydrolase
VTRAGHPTRRSFRGTAPAWSPVPPLEGVVFDLDRTLLDVRSQADYARALTDVRRLVGGWKDVTTPETSWDGPLRTCVAVLVALTGDSRWRRVSETIELHELAAVADSRPQPGAGAVIEATAGYRRAVVTLLPERAARAALARHDVRIDAVVPRRPDLRPSPAPDQLLEASRLIDTDPAAVVMVGSSPWDEEAAGAAGTAFVGITGGGRSVFDDGVITVASLEDVASLLGAAGRR